MSLEERGGTGQRSFRAVGVFSGIGGLELGLAASGHRTNLFCEIHPAARAVLEAQFPSVPIHHDIRSLNTLPSDTQLIVGGFPCQDLSQAGRTVGISGARSGLVEEVFRLLRCRPVPWVVLENVPFMLQLDRGRALDLVLGRFEELGYRWAYRIVNARAFGVPQRRERVFFVASLEGDPRDVLLADDSESLTDPEDTSSVACGFYWTEGIRGLGWAVDAIPTLKGGSSVGVPSPPAIRMPDGRIVTPEIRDAERLQGFKEDWTRPAVAVSKRGVRWMLVGNSVNVSVAEWLGRRLAEPGHYRPDWDAIFLRRGTPWPRAAWNVGEGRYSAKVSAWPVATPAPHLHEFLKFETPPLSERATAGFRERTKRAHLVFPPGFLAAVDSHLAQIRQQTVVAQQDSRRLAKSA